MLVQTKPLAEVTQTAIRVLCKEIGLVDTMRFVGQFTVGYGNYTEERAELFADMTLDDMITEIQRKRTQAYASVGRPGFSRSDKVESKQRAQLHRGHQAAPSYPASQPPTGSGIPPFAWRRDLCHPTRLDPAL